MGYLKSIGTGFIYIGVFMGIITFLPGLPPYNAHYEEYSISPPKELKGDLGLNSRLEKAEKLFEGVIIGPECFAAYGRDLYTGLQADGVVRITKNGLVPVVNFGQKPCEHMWRDDICGKPLGMAFDKQGNLFVSDPYHGLFKVDVNTGNHEKIIDITKPIDGKVPMLCNSMDIASNGDIYWSDSSTEFPLKDGVYALLTNPSGRLLRYNAKTKQNEVLVENLGFANGVKLSKNEDFVIVAETLTSRIIKYNLKGSKAGQQEIFIEGLPGMPDNLHSDGQNGFLVTMVVYADENHPQLPQVLMPHPLLRKMLARLQALLELPFKCLHEYMPNFYSERIISFVGSFRSVMWLGADITLVLRIDETGKIIDTAYTADDGLRGISSAFIHDEYLWLGSPTAENLVRVPLAQAFPSLAKIEGISSGVKSTGPKEIKEKPKSTTQKSTTTPKSTTTTQKPTTTTQKPSTTSKPVKPTASGKKSGKN